MGDELESGESSNVNESMNWDERERYGLESTRYVPDSWVDGVKLSSYGL